MQDDRPNHNADGETTLFAATSKDTKTPGFGQMALNRTILERQLENAQSAQKAYEDSMGETDPKARKRDTKWRSLDASRRAVATRLFALKKLEVRDAALISAKESAE